MWIDREIEPLLRRRAAQRPVVVLTGARQTGKTSLVRHLFPDHEQVSLDLPSEAEQAEKDPSGFLARHSPPVVVDEVQYAPGLFRHLKVAVDRDRGRNGQFILTGSQKLTLMRSVSESLAGRAEVLELEGLSWSEIRAQELPFSVEEVVVRGGFPELYEKPEIDAEGYYRSYVATYLERDLRQMLQVTSLRDYERFLRACALRTAQLLNKADLSRDVGISGSTAGQWLSVLQATNQVVLLEPWFSNRTKSLVKRPKLYLGDSGLAAFLTGVRQSADDSPLIGALWETMVFSEIRRRQLARHGGWDLSFWRDRSKESDFLFHRGGRFLLADAKWTEHPDRHDASALRRVASELDVSLVDRLGLICRAANPYPIVAKVEAMPLAGIDALID
jgi:predicted AAA+ superfamily ATPase